MLNAYFKDKSVMALPVLSGRKNAAIAKTQSTREAMLTRESFLFLLFFMTTCLLDNAASADFFTCIVTYNNQQTTYNGTEETNRCGETVVCAGTKGHIVYVGL